MSTGEPESKTGPETGIRIALQKPPKEVWDQAHEQFELDDERVVYTYGSTIYNPAGIHIDACLEVHEHTHTKQQASYGSIEGWWKEYFENPKFRQLQEMLAYREQYRRFCKGESDRNERAKYLWTIATHLSSPMYGAGISHSDAMKQIRS